MTIAPQVLEVALPSGFAEGGTWRRKVWLRPWNGADVENIIGEEAVAAVCTTAILSRCVSLDNCAPVGSEFVRNLIVGDREALLLHLRRITLGDRLDCVLICPSCNEKLDLEVRPSDVLLPTYKHSQTIHSRSLVCDGCRYDIQFRLPTGADQEAVVELAARDATAAARVVLERCIEQVNGAAVTTIPVAIADALPNVMAELDPQAEVRLSATCPACHVVFEALFDSAFFIQQELSQARSRIRHEVHLLASHYHWSEADILAMGESKRLSYLKLVRDEFANRRGQAS